jgi:hypothetical protein
MQLVKKIFQDLVTSMHKQSNQLMLVVDDDNVHDYHCMMPHVHQ